MKLSILGNWGCVIKQGEGPLLGEGIPAKLCGVPAEGGFIGSLYASLNITSQ